MRTALHLTYRPQTLADLVGQPYIQKALTNAIIHQQIAPAYLFAGVRGTGKTSTARILAKSLNCLSSSQPTITPCSTCQSCRQIERGNSLDVMEIDAASNNSVHDARDLVERVPLAPIQGRYRIFIIDEFHTLTDNASNALLKCIEEPPAHAVFIFCTTELDRILPTIISRCQRFDFRALSIAAIVQQLQYVSQAEGISIESEALLAIARLSQGGLRDALQLLSQVRLLDEAITTTHVVEMAGGIAERDLLALLKAIAGCDVLSLLQVARQLIDSGRSPRLLLHSLIQVYRDLLIIKSTTQAQTLLTGAIRSAALEKLSTVWDYLTIHAALLHLQTAEAQLRHSPNANAWAEVCLLNLVPGLGTTTTAKAADSTNPQSQANGTHPNGNGQPNGKSQKPLTLVTATRSPAQATKIWQIVIQSATPQTRTLLTQAQLISLEASHATLQVNPKQLKTFQANADKVTKMLQKATGDRSLTLSLREG